MKYHLAATALLAALAGCASTPPSDSSAGTAPGAAVSPNDSRSARAAGPSTASAPASTKSGSADAGTAPMKRSVYFDYDSSAVKDEFKPVVQSNATYLGKQRGSRVTVQGNTDERGSREYNLALGQRRADAVKQTLTLLGVPSQSIESVSFGEEKPRADGENEQALAENRRADIVYGR